MEIGFHVFEQDIDILVVICSNGLKNLYNVGVLKLFEDLYLTVRSLGISSMLKGVKYFLQGKDAFGWLFLNFPDVSVGTWSDLFEDCEAFKEVAFDEGRVVLWHED